MIALMLILGKALLVAGVALAVVYVASLTLTFLADWFRDRAARIRGYKNKLAVTVIDDIKNGNCNFVQGIFDNDTMKFTEGRRIHADQVDEDVYRMHTKGRATIWE